MPLSGPLRGGEGLPKLILCLNSPNSMPQSHHSTEVVMSTRGKKGKDTVRRRRKNGVAASGREQVKKEGQEREGRRGSASPSERKEQRWKEREKGELESLGLRVSVCRMKGKNEYLGE